MTSRAMQAARMQDAADLLDASILRATPGPWVYYDEHGRDYSDEAWSVVGIQSPTERPVAFTYGPGYETDNPEDNAALIAILSSAGPHLPAALRAAAGLANAGRDDDPLLVAMVAVTNAILDLFEDVEREQVEDGEGKVIHVCAVGGKLRRS